MERGPLSAIPPGKAVFGTQGGFCRSNGELTGVLPLPTPDCGGEEVMCDLSLPILCTNHGVNDWSHAGVTCVYSHFIPLQPISLRR